MLLTLLVTVFILIGLWCIYRIFGSRQNNAVTRFLHLHFPTVSTRIDSTLRRIRNNSDVFSRVPKVFTQPHILPDHLLTSKSRGKLAQSHGKSVSVEQTELPISSTFAQQTNTPVFSSNHSPNHTNAPLIGHKNTNNSDTSGNHQLNSKAIDAMKQSAEPVRPYAEADKSKSTEIEFLPNQLFKPASYSDDLKKIKGIGKVMEKTLNGLGVNTFKQLGDFEASDIQRVANALAVFPGRIDRDEWVKQAQQLHRIRQGETTDA